MSDRRSRERAPVLGPGPACVMHSPVLLAKPVLIVEALLCPPANQRGEMSSRQWCVRPRSPPAPTRAPGGARARPPLH
eukprot:scaffold28209_cov41-Phaeocystis_antarctica.AAC.3